MTVDPNVEDFLAWLAADEEEVPVRRRCIEWIVRCAGRVDFEAHDVDDAIASAELEPSAARQVDNIRTTGAAWLRWRAEPIADAVEDTEARVGPPGELPEGLWISRARAVVAARPEVRGASLVELAIGREDPRPVLWLELAEATPDPERVIAEVSAQLPACTINDRFLTVRGAGTGPVNELCRRTGTLIHERIASTANRVPPIREQEAVVGVLNKRHTLELMIDIDGSVAMADCLRALERKVTTWQLDRRGKAKGVMIGFCAPRRLHEAVIRDVEAAISGRWAKLVTDGVTLQVAVFDEHGERVKL